MQAEIQYCRDVGVLTYYAENENPYVRSLCLAVLSVEQTDY